MESASKRIVARLESGWGWSSSVTEAQLPLSIGRDGRNAIQIEDRMVSRHHGLFELLDGMLHLTDFSSNGTIVGDTLVQGSSKAITQRTPLVFGTVLLWVNPSRVKGADFREDRRRAHGVCLVDISASSTISLKALDRSVHSLRRVLIGRSAGSILHLKQLGDACLLVFRTPLQAVSAAERALTWQRGPNNENDVSIHAAVDAGRTFAAQDGERMGLSIIRVTRIEKTQVDDLERLGRRASSLSPVDRCLITAGARRHLPRDRRRRCVYLGSRTLKGFGPDLFKVYQYEG